MAAPTVVAAAAVGVPDAVSGEAVAVAVVPDRGAMDADQVRDLVRRMLGPAHVPGVVLVTDRLPLLRNGKLDRRGVPRPARRARRWDGLR